MVYKMPYKSEKILRSGQIAANVRPADINPDSKISYLALDYGNALGIASSQKNVMTPQQADDFLKECHPLTFLSGEGTLEQIRKKVERTGQL
jgi:hypothetical protein